MSINKTIKIAGITFKELARQKLFYLLLFFSLAIIIGSYFMNFFDIEAQTRLIKDFSLSGISFFTIILTIALTLTMVFNEIENKTIYPVLAKPINRLDYLLGKFFGVMFLIFINILVLSFLTLIILYIKDHIFYVEIFKASFLMLLEATLICAMVLFFSIIVTPPVNISLAIFIYCFGHLSSIYINYLTELTQNTTLSFILKITKAIIPQLEFFSIKDAVVHNHFVGGYYLLEVTLYGLLYTLFLILLSYLFFDKKDL